MAFIRLIRYLNCCSSETHDKENDHTIDHYQPKEQYDRQSSEQFTKQENEQITIVETFHPDSPKYKNSYEDYNYDVIQSIFATTELNHIQKFWLQKIGRTIEIENSPILQLEVIETQEFGNQKVIEISPIGYLKSKRVAQDGVTIFGSRNFDSSIILEKEAMAADVIASTGKYGFKELHFAIYYEPDEKCFKILDLNKESETLYLLSQTLPLTKPYVLQFGNQTVQVENQQDNIKIQILAGTQKNQELQEIIQILQQKQAVDKNRENI